MPSSPPRSIGLAGMRPLPFCQKVPRRFHISPPKKSQPECHRQKMTNATNRTVFQRSIMEDGDVAERSQSNHCVGRSVGQLWFVLAEKYKGDRPTRLQSTRADYLNLNSSAIPRWYSA